MEFVKGLLGRIHVLVTLPGLRDHHHDGMGQVVAPEMHELKDIVEAGRVRAILVDHRKELVDIGTKLVGLAKGFPGLHEVLIAHDRVDLTIVGDETVWMGARPTGERVGGEPGVHQGQGRFKVRVMEIRKILRQLAGREHPLVNHRPGGKPGDIEILTTGEGFLGCPVDIVKLRGNFIEPDGIADPLADHIELPLKIHDIAYFRRALDKDLLDNGLVATGCLAKNLALHGDGTPGNEFLALLADNVLKKLHRGLTLAGRGREENQSAPVVSLLWQLNALFRHRLPKKLVRRLDEDTCPIPRVGVRTARPPVNHVLIHGEGLLDDVMGALALEVGNKSYPTGILFP